MLAQAIPTVAMGAIFIALALVPGLLSKSVEALHHLNEQFHRELGSPLPPGARTYEKPVATEWLAVAGVILMTLGLLLAITN